jgi:hypothetical protein
MSGRWDEVVGGRVEAPDVDAFLAEIVEVCRRHNMAIGHEDMEGRFLIARGYSPKAADWLLQASITDDAGPLR